VTCLYCGISRQCFYKWLRRYEELGEEGLRDRSSALPNYPKATRGGLSDRPFAEPLPVRAEGADALDELRIDLDPLAEAGSPDIPSH
jgi:hypothetical protein